MKDYKEMAHFVLECRDKQIRIKKARQRAILKYMSAAASFIFIFVLGHKAYSDYNSLPKLPISDTPAVSSEASETAYPATDESNEETSFEMMIYTENTELQTSVIYEETKILPEISQTQHKIIDIPKETSISYNTEITNTSAVYTEMPTEIYEITSTTTIPDELTADTPFDTVPKWENMPNAQRYFMCTFNENDYGTLNSGISEEETESYLGEVIMYGYDLYTDTYYQCIAKAYKLKNQSESNIIAVVFDGEDKFFLYKNYSAD